MLPLQKLAELVYNTPLFITPAKAEVISSVLMAHIEARISGVSVEKSTNEKEPRPSSFVGEALQSETGRGNTPYRVTRNGQSIITIDGELVNRGEWIGADSGLVSYDGIKHQLAEATRDSRVRSIILDINSPGGEAIGAVDAAAAVRKAAEKKPVIAVANGVAASAAYGLASGATRRVIAPDGIGGSIGVVMMHLDFSRALENRGIKPTFIFAGAHKVDGNPYEKLPESVRAQLQSEINQFYDLFVQTVVKGTGLTEEQIRGTEAQLYIGQDAVDAGLFDDVGTFDDVLSGKIETTSPRVAAATPNSKQQEKDMSTNATPAQTGAPDVTAQIADLAKRNADLQAKLDAAEAEKKKAQIEKAKTEASSKVDAWEKEGKFSGNATREARSVYSAIVAGETVTAEMFDRFVAALPKFDTSRVGSNVQPQTTSISTGVTIEDFAKQATDAEAARRISAAVASRQKENPKFSAEELRRELSGK